MKCPQCDRPFEPEQNFCNGCGAALAGIGSEPAADSETPADPGHIASNEDAADEADEPAGDGQAATDAAGHEPIEDDTDSIAATAPHPQVENDPELTQLIAQGEDPTWADPDWAPTGSLPTAPMAAPPQPETEAPSSTDDLWAVSTQSANPQSVGVTAAPTELLAARDDGGSTAAMPATAVRPSATPPPTAAAPATGPQFSIITILGFTGAILALAAMFTTVVAISSNVELTPNENIPAGFVLGQLSFGHLASSLPIAGLLAACGMAAGGVAAAYGWRWGAGLAGGSGLAFAGLAALAIGLAQQPIDAARAYAQIPSETAFTLSLTRDIGYWLLLVAAAIGIVLFFATLNDAAADRRRDLNPWIAALGALATVVTVIGPTLPVQLAAFSDNWYLIEGPGEASAMLIVGRLIQLVLIGVSGVIGFLMVRRYGLGLAAGGTLPALWLGGTVIAGLGDNPVGPGWRNPGADQMELHGVTIIGVAALLSMLLIAVAAAYNQSLDDQR